MTNSEYYLKESANKSKLILDITKRISKYCDCRYYSTEVDEELERFFNEEYGKDENND